MKKRKFIECRPHVSSCNRGVTLSGRGWSTPQMYIGDWVLLRKSPKRGYLGDISRA